MGLDFVEVTMEIEDRFRISIPDEDAVRLETVGAIFEYVRSRVGGNSEGTCACPIVFRKVRDAMIQCLGVPRCAIRPRAALDALMPHQDRVEAWERLGHAAGLVLPPPSRNIETDMSGWAATITAASVGAAVLAHDAGAGLLFWFSTLVAAGAAVYFARSVTSTVTCRLPSPTVRHLVYEAMSLNPDVVGDNVWSDARIWSTIRQVIIDVLGAKPEEVTKAAHLDPRSGRELTTGCRALHGAERCRRR